MCLNLKPNAKIQIATEDITVYKKVYPTTIIKRGLKTGDVCTAIIKGYVVNGVISIEEKEIFICYNNSNIVGCSCNNKQGFPHSWCVDSMVTSIIVNDKEYIQPGYKTQYRQFKIILKHTYKSKLIIEKEIGYNFVNIGIHSFVNIPVHMTTNVIKCIIPKGSNYIVGSFNCQKSIASDKIKYLEVVK